MRASLVFLDALRIKTTVVSPERPFFHPLILDPSEAKVAIVTPPHFTNLDQVSTKRRSALMMAQTGPPPMKAGRLYVNPEEEDQMEISGFRPHTLKTAVVWFFIIITVGLLRLFFYWLPHLFIKATHSRCSLAEATTVLLKDQWKQWFNSTVKTEEQTVPFKNSQTVHQSQTSNESAKQRDGLIRYFICKKIKYIWDKEMKEFTRLRGFDKDRACSFFYQQTGLAYDEQRKRQVLYGINSIRVHVAPIIKILFKEVLSPFYVFQVFSVSVWFADDYTIYASCIVFISGLSIIITIYQTRKMQRALRSTITSSTIVTVCRGGDVYEDISSDDLVPGDVIEVPRHGCMMQCDAVLVSGNCIVNESMLTGESVPVTKTPLPNPLHASSQEAMFDIKKHSRHILFCGTHVIQTRYYGSHKVNAVVLRSGFLTAKGELVRSIMFPKPVDFKFNRDTYWFIGILAFLASLGFIYTLILMVRNGDTVSDIIIRTLDLLTITVPPALPAALSVGIVFAQQRLKKAGIFCISPRGINICGTINVVCFDKTGTLTEDGMKMMAVAPSPKGVFEHEIRNMNRLHNQLIISAMATCHSLTIIDGHVTGDPLDLIMFEAVDWVLEEPGEEETRFDMIVPTIVHPRVRGGNQPMGEDIGVVRQFTFSSSLQRMSVITRNLGANNFDLFVKGAPEMITSLSKAETVPGDFHDVLMAYTQHGYRVIALAWKALPQKLNYAKLQRITREQVEKDLNFLGLLVMENCLKPETTPVIQTLREAAIRNIMVTGDNMLTALSVARECCMVDRTDRIVLVQAYPPQDDNTSPEIEFVFADEMEKKYSKDSIALQLDNDRFHFALTGKSWAVIRQHFPDLMSKIVVKGTVFARMGPEQKAQLVESLQALDYFVGMCGDGANDCGALKTAHAGISLSEAEASVASPFTSKKPTIECVPNVIRQGRAALVTSFGIFKFMACYSLTQFISVLLLYWIGANLTDTDFLIIDLFIVTTLSITFGRTGPCEELVKELPPFSLIAAAPIMSILAQIAIQLATQVYCFLHVLRQPWFVPYIDNEDDNYVSYENSAVFLVSSYQYITLAVAFSKGAPFRKPIFSNYLFLMNIAICLVGCLWVTIQPPQGLADIIELLVFPSIPYAMVHVGIALFNCLLSILVETYVMDNTSLQGSCRNFLKHSLPSAQTKYAAIEEDIAGNPSWPPVSQSAVSLAVVFQRLDSAHHVPKDLNTAPGKEILEDLIEDSDSETRSIKSLSGVTPGHTQNAAASYTQRQLSTEGGHHNTEQFETPLLSDGAANSSGGIDNPVVTSFDDNGRYTTFL
ncbi:polyamine-transporting ATPase 13A3-like isoform X3 [Haliotis rufescens]|uniref:polyamine-transporting ATPase 13A3-like isoform X3 n=1 Tax=Haliotis rufescens TaxID=6454 RepID=UPI00201F0F07|nr:polyamine-transporting ATPase 13A3-like isoform X3 [Haliotis rufescens]